MTAALIDETETRSGKFAGTDPYALARDWLDAARESEINDPEAVALATVDATGMPNVRMVLLKEIEADRAAGGFLFYTNFESAKGRELAGQPRAAMVLHWKSLRRQLRLRGPVERVEDDKADAYFASRPYKSRLGAIASAQSRPLSSRASLIGDVAKLALSHPLDPPRPPHWGGFRLRPVEIEFWADGDYRLHDRFRWTREAPDADRWQVRRLNP